MTHLKIVKSLKFQALIINGLQRLTQELLRIHLVIGDQLRAALDAAAQLVTQAAGGTDAVTKDPFARVLLGELARHRNLPPFTAAPKSRQAHLRAAWMAIDAAVAAVPEIQFDARKRASAY